MRHPSRRASIQSATIGNRRVEDDPEGVTFWKIEHRIRWTGMPSWKASLTEQQT